MEPLSNVIRISLPNYLSSLPIPTSIGGWFRLGVRDWISLVPFGAAVGGITFLVYKAYCPRAREPPTGKVNSKVRKDSPKVVDTFDLEDIGDKVAFCRCWKSNNWPYCDGAHGAHNKETGDNVGPVCLKRKSKG